MKNRENNRRVKSGGIVMGYLEELENCIDIIQTDSRFVSRGLFYGANYQILYVKMKTLF